MNSPLKTIILLAIICGLLTVGCGLLYAGKINTPDGLDSTTITLEPQASAPAGTEGGLYYNTSKTLYYRNETAWQAMGAGTSGERYVATKIVAASNSQGTTGCPAACTNPRADTTCAGTQTTGDDEVTINQAITDVSTSPAGGGAVYLLEGNYWITDMIKVRSNVAIIGAGAGTVISPKNSATLSSNGVITNYDTTNGNTNILLTNFKIDGNRANNLPKVQYGVCFSKVTYSKIDKVWLENRTAAGIYLYPSCDNNTISGNHIQGNSDGGYGIQLGTSSNNTISGNNIRGNSFEAIYLNSSSDRNTISGNNLQSNIRGIYLYSSSNNTISGNNIQSNNYEGINFSTSPCNNNTISGNNIQSNLRWGICFYYGSNNTISGNNIQGNSQYGIRLYSASNNNTISGNIIYDNGGTGNYSGINIESGSDNNLLSSNLLSDSAGTGWPINIAASTCDNTYIVGNLIASWPSGYEGIIDSGTGTKYTQKEKLTIERATAVQVTAASPNIDPATTPRSYIPAYSDSSSGVTATISNGKSPGDMLILEGTNETNYVKISSGANIKVIATHDLKLNDTLKLLWDGTYWVEVAYVDN